MRACVTVHFVADASSELVGLITISAKPDSLGNINSVNNAGLRMVRVCSRHPPRLPRMPPHPPFWLPHTQFGLSAREVVGRNISTLIPEPIASVHQRYLEAYLTSGKEVMLNTTRTVFGLHSRGHIFPMNMGLRAMHPGFGALVQAIPSEDNFILVRQQDLRLCACSLESLAMLGVTPEVYNNEDVSVAVSAGGSFQRVTTATRS